MNHNNRSCRKSTLVWENISTISTWAPSCDWGEQSVLAEHWQKSSVLKWSNFWWLLSFKHFPLCFLCMLFISKEASAVLTYKNCIVERLIKFVCLFVFPSQCYGTVVSLVNVLAYWDYPDIHIFIAQKSQQSCEFSV